MWGGAGRRSGLRSPDGRWTRATGPKPSGCNDRRRGCSGLQGNVAWMKTRLAARKIRVVHMDFFGRLKRTYEQPDGIHLSAEGHARAAAMILPQMLAGETASPRSARPLLGKRAAALNQSAVDGRAPLRRAPLGGEVHVDQAEAAPRTGDPLEVVVARSVEVAPPPPWRSPASRSEPTPVH